MSKGDKAQKKDSIGIIPRSGKIPKRTEEDKGRVQIEKPLVMTATHPSQTSQSKDTAQALRALSGVHVHTRFVENLPESPLRSFDSKGA